uniref:Cytochrome P450 n=1 Tax=Strongyloides stercoralis TaxID=6248 RepID=A0A0K0EM43_STRER
MERSKEAIITDIKKFWNKLNNNSRKIHFVIQDSWDYLDNSKDKDNVDICKVIQLFIGNVVNSLLFGYMNANNNSKSFFEFVSTLNKSAKKVINKKSKKKLRQLTDIKIEKCKKTYNFDEEPTNFIHAVMIEIQSIDSKYNYLSSDHLRGLALDFRIAGIETLATTLKWFILIIMKHLNIQERLQNEIDEVIGKENLVQLSDKAKMSYMRGFIFERQRYINMVPFVPQHKCTKDTIIKIEN